MTFQKIFSSMADFRAVVSVLPCSPTNKGKKNLCGCAEKANRQWAFVAFWLSSYVNIKTAAAFANWLAPKKGAVFSLIYFFGSICCIYYIPHNYVILQAMPHAIPQLIQPFTLTEITPRCKDKFATPCNTNNSKLNETKDQFRIRSTKRSRGEPFMVPKLPTSQIFKGLTYELKYRACRFCLNKKQANLLLYFGVIFSKLEKIITYLKFARIQKLLHSECIKKRNSWIHFTKIFLCAAETHYFFLLLHMFLSCSFKNITWSHTLNERNQNNSGAKALRILIFLWRSKMQLSVTSSYIQKWISPGL